MVPEGDFESLILRQRDVEVPSQQVCSAQWHDGHGNTGLGQSISNNPDRPVTAGSDDPIHLGRNNLLRDCRTWILFRGLQPDGIIPAARCGLPSDRFAEIVGRLDLVVDHRTAAPRRPIHSVAPFA